MNLFRMDLFHKHDFYLNLYGTNFPCFLEWQFLFVCLFIYFFNYDSWTFHRKNTLCPVWFYLLVFWVVEVWTKLVQMVRQAHHYTNSIRNIITFPLCWGLINCIIFLNHRPAIYPFPNPSLRSTSLREIMDFWIKKKTI